MHAAAISEQELTGLRDELVSHLRWKRANGIEDLAQEALLRILQKLYAGEHIDSLKAYGRRVADLVYLEDLRLRRRETELASSEAAEQDHKPELLSRCLETCKKKCLKRREIVLIEEYYESNAAERKLLARSHNLSEGELRREAMKIRTKLRECVKACMQESDL